MLENSDEFGDSLCICQSFTHQLLVASEKAIKVGLKFTNAYFTKCNLVSNSPKFSNQSFPLYSMSNTHNFKDRIGYNCTILELHFK